MMKTLQQHSNTPYAGVGLKVRKFRKWHVQQASQRLLRLCVSAVAEDVSFDRINKQTDSHRTRNQPHQQVSRRSSDSASSTTRGTSNLGRDVKRGERSQQAQRNAGTGPSSSNMPNVSQQQSTGASPLNSNGAPKYAPRNTRASNTQQSQQQRSNMPRNQGTIQSPGRAPGKRDACMEEIFQANTVEDLVNIYRHQSYEAFCDRRKKLTKRAQASGREVKDSDVPPAQMNIYHYVAMLVRLPKMLDMDEDDDSSSQRNSASSAGSSSHASSELDEARRLAAHIMVNLSKRKHTLTYRSLANVIWAVARLEFEATYTATELIPGFAFRQLLLKHSASSQNGSDSDAGEDEDEGRGKFEKPQGLVNKFTTNMDEFVTDWFMTACTPSVCNRAKPQEISNVAYSIVRLQQQGLIRPIGDDSVETLLRRWWDAVINTVLDSVCDDMTEKELSQLTWAIGRSGQTIRADIIHALVARLPLYMHRMNQQLLNTTVLSMAVLLSLMNDEDFMYTDQLPSNWLQRSRADGDGNKSKHQSRPGQSANETHSAHHSGHHRQQPPPQHANMIQQDLEEFAQQYEGKNVTTGQLIDMFYSVAAEAVKSNVQRYGPMSWRTQHVANCMWSMAVYANLDVYDTVVRKDGVSLDMCAWLCDMADNHFVARHRSYDPAEMAMLSWSIVRLSGRCSDAMLTILADEIENNAAAHPPRNLLCFATSAILSVGEVSSPPEWDEGANADGHSTRSTEPSNMGGAGRARSQAGLPTTWGVSSSQKRKGSLMSVDVLVENDASAGGVSGPIISPSCSRLAKAVFGVMHDALLCQGTRDWSPYEALSSLGQQSRNHPALRYPYKALEVCGIILAAARLQAVDPSYVDDLQDVLLARCSVNAGAMRHMSVMRAGLNEFNDSIQTSIDQLGSGLGLHGNTDDVSRSAGTRKQLDHLEMFTLGEQACLVGGATFLGAGIPRLSAHVSKIVRESASATAKYMQARVATLRYATQGAPSDDDEDLTVDPSQISPDLQPPINLLSFKDIADTAFAFSRTAQSHDKVFFHVLATAAYRSLQFHHYSQYIKSRQQRQSPDDMAVDNDAALAKALSGPQVHVTPEGILNLARGLNSADYYNEGLMNFVVKSSLQLRLACSPGQLVHLATAHAHAQHINVQLFNELATAAMGRAHEFTSQQLGNMLWAYAHVHVFHPGLFNSFMEQAGRQLQSGLMPVRVACSLVWSCAVTSFPCEAVERELFKLVWRSGPPETMGHEDRHQVYFAYVIRSLTSRVRRAKRIGGQTAPTASPVFPPPIPAAYRETYAVSFLQMREQTTVSDLQQSVFSTLKRMGCEPEMEVGIKSGLFMVDLVAKWKGQLVAVEVDGPSHFARNIPTHALGATVARNRCLRALGLKLACVHWMEWRAAFTAASRQRAIDDASYESGYSSATSTDIDASKDSSTPSNSFRVKQTVSRRRSSRTSNDDSTQADESGQNMSASSPGGSLSASWPPTGARASEDNNDAAYEQSTDARVAFLQRLLDNATAPAPSRSAPVNSTNDDSSNHDEASDDSSGTQHKRFNSTVVAKAAGARRVQRSNVKEDPAVVEKEESADQSVLPNVPVNVMYNAFKSPDGKRSRQQVKTGAKGRANRNSEPSTE